MGPDQVRSGLALPAAPVTIHEDAFGIPRVEARSLTDAAFALGYLHGEQRLFQMDMQRRLGQGRLSELVGKRTVGADRFLRTLGLGRAAQRMYDALPDDERRIVDAYVEGVNLAIDRLPPPPEYALLGSRPAPWTAVDSLVWLEVMNLNLSGDFRSEALRARLDRAVGRELTDRLMPERPYPDDGPIIWRPPGRDDTPDTMPHVATAPAEADDGKTPAVRAVGSRRAPWADGLELALALVGEGIAVGSNNWVVHGDRTATGKPILASDPHLQVRIPGTWFLAEIDTPEVHAIGSTLPGLPGIVIGHNEHIAWGLTNGTVDVQDLFYERLDDPTQVQSRIERIRVRRGRDVELTVRETPRGPIVTDFVDGMDREVSLAWTVLRPGDRTVTAMLGVARARDWPSFLAALEHYDGAPQNFVYADVEGHIGYKLAGRIPLRTGRTGHRPARGWIPEDDWQGYVPFEQLPEIHDPPEGYIVTANNAPAPPTYPVDLGYYADAPYRAARIVALLGSATDWTVASTYALQMDVKSLQADEVLPFLRRLEPTDPEARRALEILAGWDGHMTVDAAAPAVYEAWLVAFTEALGRPHLGDLTSAWLAPRPTLIRRVLDGRDADLCIPDCAALAEHGLARAMQILRRELGNDPAAWRWGDAHPVVFHHPLAITPRLRRKLDVTLPAAGALWTVDVGGYPWSDPFVMTHLPSYRQVVDLGALDRSVWITTPGQSGLPHDVHYRDLAPRHQAGDPLPMHFGPADASVVRVRTLQR